VDSSGVSGLLKPQPQQIFMHSDSKLASGGEVFFCFFFMQCLLVLTDGEQFDEHSLATGLSLHVFYDPGHFKSFPTTNHMLYDCTDFCKASF